jgi:ligand-binding SRPBCC domain-containing protein
MLYQKRFVQKIPIGMEECWEFFSNPLNLKNLTPEHLEFKIMNDLQGRRMYPGQIIAYQIRPLWNIPLEWVTEITHVEEPRFFVDEQRCGPYSLWHHEHWFREIHGGVEIEDIVHYQMPFGPVGRWINQVKVDGEIEQIFAYRKAKLEKLFGSFTR